MSDQGISSLSRVSQPRFNMRTFASAAALLLFVLVHPTNASEEAALRGSKTAVEGSKAGEEDHDEVEKQAKEDDNDEDEEDEDNGEEDDNEEEDDNDEDKDHDEGEHQEEHEEGGGENQDQDENQREEDEDEDEKDDSELTPTEIHEKRDAELVAFAGSHSKGQHCVDMVEEAERTHGLFDSPDMTDEKLQAAVSHLNAGAFKAWKMKKAKFEPQLVARILSARKKGQVGAMKICEEIFDLYKDF